MRKNKVIWTTLLIVSVTLLIGYSIWGFTLFRNSNYNSYGRGYSDRGMMGKSSNTNNGSNENGKKLSSDDVETIVEDYIKGYGDDLKVSDIFVYKDADYYVSVEERDTGRGAMELLVNPYTGQIYPEYGPNMMWNEKYSMYGGYGMMGGTSKYEQYNNIDSSKQINKEEAIKIADEYVKKNIGKEFSVPGDGHEFYGYYTFHIDQGDNAVGMMSVNYYTEDSWYHDWHGELEQVISDHKK
jgi:hypothetical protein